jgi:hypothetical protein
MVERLNLTAYRVQFARAQFATVKKFGRRR